MGNVAGWVRSPFHLSDSSGNYLKACSATKLSTSPNCSTLAEKDIIDRPAGFADNATPKIKSKLLEQGVD